MPSRGVIDMAKKKSKAPKKTKAAKAKPSKTKKSKVKKAKAKPAKKAAPARKSKTKKSKKPIKAAAKPAKKKPAKKKKQVIGEGNYEASRNFDRDQSAFVKKNEAAIPAMGKAAEAALDGPEGDSLREAEATAADRSRDTF
jgi:hypothetical protein